MKFKYKVVDTRTLAGLKKGERLVRAGWAIYSVGFNTLHLFRLDKPVPKKKVSDRITAYNTWKARDEVESREVEARKQATETLWNTATRIRG